MRVRLPDALKENSSNMKKHFALLTLGIVFSALATANAQELRVTVPFDFVVNGKTLPAATYTIQQPMWNDSNGVAFVGGGKGALARATELDSSVTGGKLVFHHVGDQYFLSDIVGLRGKWHFAPSRSEARSARNAGLQSVEITAGT
jgi:hypothetical protein